MCRNNQEDIEEIAKMFANGDIDVFLAIKKRLEKLYDGGIAQGADEEFKKTIAMMRRW